MPDLNYHSLPASDRAPQLVCERKHAHYHKSVAHLSSVDVYRVLDLFDVTNQALGHAIKKLLVAGNRGVKGMDKDVQEAIDTLQRWQEMRAEDAGVQK